MGLRRADDDVGTIKSPAPAVAEHFEGLAVPFSASLPGLGVGRWSIMIDSRGHAVRLTQPPLPCIASRSARPRMPDFLGRNGDGATLRLPIHQQ